MHRLRYASTLIFLAKSCLFPLQRAAAGSLKPGWLSPLYKSIVYLDSRPLWTLGLAGISSTVPGECMYVVDSPDMMAGDP